MDGVFHLSQGRWPGHDTTTVVDICLVSLRIYLCHPSQEGEALFEV